MNNHLTALEAQQLAEDAMALDGLVGQEELARVLDRVRDVAMKGERSLYMVPEAGYKHHVLVLNTKRLRDLGYDVAYNSDQRDGTSIIIKW